MDSLTSYLPPFDGFLPKWLLFVRLPLHLLTFELPTNKPS